MQIAIFVLFLPAAQLIDFPTEILIHIFKNLFVQECLLGIGQTCRRFHSIVMPSITTIRFVQNMPFLKSFMVTGCTSIDPQELLNCVYLCKTLTVLHVSGCTQLENEQALELANVCKELPHLKVLRGEWSCRFTAEAVSHLSSETNIVELDVTPVWSPPSEWIDMAAQHTGVIFGNSIMNHIKRVGLPSYLYEDEQDEFE